MKATTADVDSRCQHSRDETTMLCSWFVKEPSPVTREGLYKT